MTDIAEQLHSEELADVREDAALLRAEIERLREENSCLVSQRIEYEADNERLQALLSEWLRDYGDNEDSDSQLMVEKTRRELEPKP